MDKNADNSTNQKKWKNSQNWIKMEKNGDNGTNKKNEKITKLDKNE